MTNIVTAGMFAYTLSLGDPVYVGLPWPLTVLLAAAVLGYGAGCAALRRRVGHDLDSWFTLGVLGLYGLDALVLSLHPGALTGRSALLDILPGVALALGSIRRPRSAVVLAGVGLAGAVATAVHATGRSWDRYVLAELIWSVVAFAAARLFAAVLARLGREVTTELTAHHEAELAATRSAARRQEIDSVMTMLVEGERLCAGAPPGPVRECVAAELATIRARLIVATDPPPTELGTIDKDQQARQ
jgi:hypothetical protein